MRNNPNRLIISDFKDDRSGYSTSVYGKRNHVSRLLEDANPKRKQRGKRRRHSAHKPSDKQRMPALEKNSKRWQHVRDNESVKSGGANTGDSGVSSDYPRPNQPRENLVETSSDWAANPKSL